MKSFMKRLFASVFALMFITLCACQSPSKQKESGITSAETATTMENAPVRLEYAKGFQVKYISDDIRLIDICDPQNKEAEVYRFAFVSNNAQEKEGAKIPSDYKVIRVPIRKTICMTSLQLSNFIKLEAYDYITGLTSARHLFNKEINERIKAGKIKKIGMEGNFDNEDIIAANPDVILISPFKRGGYEALKEVGIPLIPHLGYKEMTPLGQAEWIKFVGLLTGKEEQANQLFEGIATRYNELKNLVAEVKERPLVFSGEIHGSNWYAVGGKSFLAQLIEDAGADYFLKDDEHSGGLNLDFETVYSQAAQADYWRIVNSYQGTFSYDALKDEDSRYADFKAFKEKQVIYCNMRTSPFYESMPMEPELVLSDLIKAFHPGMLADYQPHYYEMLP